MSDYHILDGDESGDGIAYTVVMHFPVPNENNSAGVNLRTAISQDVDHSTDSIVPWITTTEQGQLDSGELWEEAISYKRNPNNSLVQDRNALDSKFTNGSTKAADKVRGIYKYWGYDRVVP